jgi:hypothetical protein
MAGIITTGAHPKAMWEGIHKWYGMEYAKHPLECAQVFDIRASQKKYEEVAESKGFGLAVVKGEGSSVSYDSMAQGDVTRFTHVLYGLGYVVSLEELQDNLYFEVSKTRAARLAFSMRITKETVAANVLNRGFNSSYTGGDGVELFSTSHVTDDGNQSNHLTVAADLSEASLEDMCIQINLATDTRGLKIALRGRKMIVPPNLQFEAQRILYSSLQSGTANNDTNAVRDLGVVPEGFMVNHYLTDTDAWFIKTDCPDGLIGFQRMPMAFTQDNDFDTSNAKAKAIERYVFGWGDWRGCWGSPGA